MEVSLAVVDSILKGRGWKVCLLDSVWEDLSTSHNFFDIKVLHVCSIIDAVLNFFRAAHDCSSVDLDLSVFFLQESYFAGEPVEVSQVINLLVCSVKAHLSE
jgi:hypothetical protein